MQKSQDTKEEKPSKQPKVVLVHDFLMTRGGAERVLGVLAEMYPEAPIYTLLYDREAMGDFLADRDIRTSFLQRLPRWLRRRHRLLLPLYPAALEALDMRDFDVVISSSSAWAKGVVTRLATRHIAYIHSPMRYVWDANERYLQETSGRRFRLCKRLILSYLRVWDAQAADRPDRLVANSEYTRARIAKYYRRESQVVYPSLMPLTESPKATTRDFFLVVSRLTKSKHIDSVVEAFNKLGLPLVVVGRGPEREHLKHLAGPTVRIVGWKSDEVLAKMYARARAVVFPAEEDFGLVMAEAQAAGAPVIACERGGSREIVSPGVTGEFFIGQTPEVIADGVRRFLTREGRYDTAAMRACAERFSRQRFEQAFRDIVRETLV